MAEAVRPLRGAYTHAFGTTWFIINFLRGEGPLGSLKIDPTKGATQSDLHSAYKLALHISLAEDLAARDMEEAIKAGRPYPPEEAEIRRRYYLDRIPSRLTRMRYSSFTVYFGLLKRLGWVEPTGEEEEPSEAQEKMALKPGEPPRETGRPRIYYRLTAAGMAEEVPMVFDPVMALYPHYSPEQRHGKRRLYFTRRR